MMENIHKYQILLNLVTMEYKKFWPLFIMTDYKNGLFLIIIIFILYQMINVFQIIIIFFATLLNVNK